MHPDHVTVVVRDLAEARLFFGHLDFEETHAVVINGDTFSPYMGVEGMEADHVTLVLKGHSPRFEIQLLHYRNPEPTIASDALSLNKTGYNHLCFSVDDLEGKVEELEEAGIQPRTEILEFNNRKLVFLTGPEGITVELAQWMN